MKKAVFTLLFSLCSLAAFAQTAAFLNINPDAAVAGMAGAGIATASGMENNPAAMALSPAKLDVYADYVSWQPSVTGNTLLAAGGSYRLSDRIALAASFKNFTSPEYTAVSDAGRAGAAFKPRDLALALGGAFRIMDGLAAGLDVKYISSSLAESAKAGTVAADLSVKYAKDALQAGFALTNLGGKLNYGGSDYSLPSAVKAGAAYTYSGVTAAFEADYIMSAGITAALGVEYAWKDMVFARAGYHYGSAPEVIPSCASLGLGAKLFGARLDIAYLLGSETLGGTLAFGLGYSF